MLDSKVSVILMRQLPLPISAAAQPSLDNYVAGANAEALQRVRAAAAGRLKEAIVYLWGEPGCGRSHLLRAAAGANPHIVITAARDGGPPVLAAGNAPPARLGLREDLRTRLAWGLVYQLKPLTDAEKALYLR